MRYLLDTNICIYVMKRQPPQVRERLRRTALDDVAISGIVLAELHYGIRKSRQSQRNEAALADFLSFCRVLDWPSQAALLYGEIRAQLERKGRTIGNDLLIAAHALYLDATLVTNNIGEFGRVANLKIENWSEG